MSASFCEVTIIGHAGADAETRFMPSGATATNVNVAVTESWRDRQTGQMQEKTEWHRLVFKDRGNYRLGQIAGDLIKQGSHIFVKGTLRNRQWEKDGVKRYTTEIEVSELKMLGSRPAQDNQGQYSAPEAPAPQQPAPDYGQPQSFGSWSTPPPAQ